MPCFTNPMFTKPLSSRGYGYDMARYDDVRYIHQSLKSKSCNGEEPLGLVAATSMLELR